MKNSSAAVDELNTKHLVHRVSAALDLAFNEGLYREKTDPTRMNRLRISGFPFCGVRWFADLQRKTARAVFNGSSMRYYTQVGNVLHAVMQDGLASLDLDPMRVSVVGNWTCSDPSCSRVHRIQEKPLICVKCGGRGFRYDEAEINAGSVFGHIDMILSLWLRSNTKAFPGGKVWIVLDWKTTSLKKVNAKESEFPYTDNVSQIAAYVGQLHELGHPVLPLAMLVYTPRDNPRQYKVCTVDVDFSLERKRVAVYVARFEQAGNAVSAKDVEEIVEDRPCKNKLSSVFRSCKRADKCAGPGNHAQVVKELEAVRVKVFSKLPILGAAR